MRSLAVQMNWQNFDNDHDDDDGYEECSQNVFHLVFPLFRLLFAVLCVSDAKYFATYPAATAKSRKSK